MARSPDPAVRLALIEAAAQLMADEGPAALSIRRVAAEVGTSTMAVYTHFGSKEDLVHEVVREAFARLHAEMVAVARTEDPVADLVAAGDAYRRNALSNAHLYRVMFSVNPLALTNPAAPDVPPGIGLDAFGDMVSAVTRCVDAGVLVGEPRHIALQIWATAHGAVSLELSGFLGADGRETFEAAVAATFLGLSP
ncbi:MAG: TetR/AcrR family transcriptional regulator [Acidimicrobiales bacterium]